MISPRCIVQPVALLFRQRQAQVGRRCSPVPGEPASQTANGAALPQDLGREIRQTAADSLYDLLGTKGLFQSAPHGSMSANAGENMSGQENTAAARVTLHVVSSLDGFIAKKDNSISWLEG